MLADPVLMQTPRLILTAVLWQMWFEEYIRAVPYNFFAGYNNPHYLDLNLNVYKNWHFVSNANAIDTFQMLEQIFKCFIAIRT